MHSWYLQENISSKAHKHIHPGHHDQKDSKPENQGAFSKHTIVCYQHDFAAQGAFTKHTLYINSTSYPLGKSASKGEE